VYALVIKRVDKNGRISFLVDVNNYF